MYRPPPRTTRSVTTFPYPTRFLARPPPRHRQEGTSTSRVRPARAIRRPARETAAGTARRSYFAWCRRDGAWRSDTRRARWGTECPSRRSEEHTSELQSLMRISYAVFCLKKKNNQLTNTHTIDNAYT